MTKNNNMFSVNERVILHLDKYNSFKEHYLIPDSITQEGIAEGVDIARNHVPRALKQLKEDSLVIERKARVEGAPRRKNAYFLSQDGKKKARELKKNREVVRTRLQSMPEIDNFVNRKDELLKLKNYLNSGKRVIVITGEDGIGKTSVVSKIGNELAKTREVFWYSISPNDSLHTFLRAFAEYLLKRGNGLLAYLLNSNIELDFDKTMESIRSAMKNSVIIIDEIDNASSEIQKFLFKFSNWMDKFEESRLVLVGREVPITIDLDEIKKSVLLKIDTLSKECIARIVKDKENIDIEQLYKLTNGHPLFVKLVRSTDVQFEDLNDLLERGFWTTLSDIEQKILLRLSLFRKPVELDLLFLENGIDYQDVVNVVEKGIIQKVGKKEYFIHDILRVFCYSRIPEKQRKKAHLKAFQWFDKQDDIIYWLEGQYHLASAGAYPESAGSIVEKAVKFVRSGYKEEMSKAIEDLEPEEIEEEMWADVLLIRGYLKKLKGDWAGAMADYESAFQIFKNAGNREKMADAKAKTARIYFEKSDLERAEKEFEKALEFLESDVNPVGARIYDELGAICVKKSDMETAEQHLNHALDIACKIKDNDMAGRINNTFGNLYLRKELWPKAKDHYSRSLEMVGGGDVQMKIITINNLAIINYKKGDIEIAIQKWEEAAKLAERIKSMNVILTFANLGYMHYLTGSWKKALHYCEKTLEISEAIGKDAVTSAAITVLGDMEFHRGKFAKAKKYYSSALFMREGLRDRGNQSASQNDLGQAYLFEGREKDARNHIEKAREIAEEINLREQTLISYLNSSRLLLMNSRWDEAKKLLQKTMSLANELGDEVLRGIVCREIGLIYSFEKEPFVAERYLKESSELLEKAGVKLELAYTKRAYGNLMKISELENPERYWKDSKDILDDMGISEKQHILSYIDRIMFSRSQ